MNVKDVMTRDVVTVSPETPLKEVAALLVEHAISGVPVVTVEGEVLGVVSEGDVLFKERGGETRRGGPLAWLVGGDGYAHALKTEATTARQAMTAPAITIGPLRSVSEAARRMTERGVNRLPVVEDGRLIGIVTRADLVRAFVRSDEEIGAEIREDVLERALWIQPDSLELEVRDGEVTVRGGRGAQRRARAREAREADPGCRLLRRGGNVARGRLGAPAGRVDAEEDLRLERVRDIPTEPVDVDSVRRRLEAGNGGYEVVHESPGLEVGVYVLVAPEPDRQQPHEDDEVYVVLDGHGTLDVEGASHQLGPGQAIFVPAGADHRFSAYEGLSLLVIFARRP